jgi:hypothetical protein
MIAFIKMVAKPLQKNLSDTDCRGERPLAPTHDTPYSPEPMSWEILLNQSGKFLPSTSQQRDLCVR